MKRGTSNGAAGLAAAAICVIGLAGCSSSGYGGGGSVHGSVSMYYGPGYYDPWHYGPGYPPPVIIAPPPVHRPPTAVPKPLPARPTPRPMPRRR